MMHMNFLLVGTCGNGISTLGNTILGQKFFITSSDIQSPENKAVKGSTQLDNYAITVVDVPGIDTDNKCVTALEKLQLMITESFNICTDGFNAVIFVLQFGNRFTRQEQETVKLLKATLGEDVVTNSTICVFTHGDLYKNKNESFLTWCKNQGGNIQDLLAECSYRCVLFDNKTKNQIDKEAQLKDLLNLAAQTKIYTLDKFITAEEGRKSLQVEISSPKIAQEANFFVNGLRSKVEALGDERTDNIEERLTLLHKYKQELEVFESNLSKKNLKPGNFINPFDSIILLKASIQSKIKLAESEKKHRDNVRTFESQYPNFNRHSQYRSTAPVKKPQIKKSESCAEHPENLKRMSGARLSLREGKSKSYDLEKERQRGTGSNKEKKCVVI